MDANNDILILAPCTRVRFLIITVFIVINMFAFLTDSYAQKTDNTEHALQIQLKNSKPDTNRIALLLNIGDFYNSQAPAYQQSALIAYQQSVALSRKLNLVEWRNRSLLKLSIQYGVLKNFKQSRQTYLQVLNYWYDRHNLKQAISVLDYLQFNFRWAPNRNIAMLNETVWCLQQKRANELKLGDTLKAVFCLKDEGDANLNMGNLAVAEDELQEVLVKLKAAHYPNLRDTYFLLSAVNHLKGNLNKELYYCIETVKESQVAKDSSMLNFMYYKLARVYEDLGMHENSLLLYNKLLSGNASKSAYTNSVICYKICQIMINQHKPHQALSFIESWQKKIHSDQPSDNGCFYNALAICYIALKQNRLAEYYFLKMISTEEKRSNIISDNDEVYFIDNMQVCDFYVSVKNYKKASHFINNIISLPKFGVSALHQSQFQLLRFKIDSAFGNYVSAIKHYEINKRITDSIFNANESNQVADIQTRYETERKDKDILLLKKQSLIDQEKYKRKRADGNLLLAGIFLLLILLVAIYSRYLLKQRNILLLQEKQKEISGKNIALEKLLNENEWLLKEVHHRVKNNLQIVTSLLHSQSAYLKDETALNAVLDSQHRVHAMSLIHQKLYKSANSTSIYMPEYIEELVQYLKDSFKTGLGIIFSLEIEPLMLDVVHAVPVGLIVNEIITNAVKYAFPFGGNDQIVIRLTSLDDGNIQLKVADNGRGLPKDFDIDQSNSFGMTLIKGLIDDLSGTCSVESSGGTMVTVCFGITQRDAQPTDNFVPHP
jgi:two-component sensor histidine kinase